MLQTDSLKTDMLHAINLSARFDSTEVFSGLNVTIDRGEIVALVGPSGCGKSTLLRILAGLQSPAAGRVVLDEIDITQWPSHKRNVGLVFQNGALFPHLSVKDNVAYGLKAIGEPTLLRNSRVAELLDLVGLAGFEKRAIGTLSGGEQQRVALARSLAPRPKVLLLDEPFASLDDDLRQRLGREVRSILRSTQTTALLVTHDQHEATRVGDRIATFASLTQNS
jgi:thiamine transport system ATP-binding protein